MTVTDERDNAPAGLDADKNPRDRLIDHWFPCAAVDRAVGTPDGSGRSEKALLTWFASRPVAQARAAVLTTLLPGGDQSLRGYVSHAVEGQRGALTHLADTIRRQHPASPPVVLDMFSGRGIIPLEAARVGATAVGIDLSPVATLGGRLLADYTFRDWSAEPRLPFDVEPGELAEPRLLHDVRLVIGEVGRRLLNSVKEYYPPLPRAHETDNRQDEYPWAYLWAVTIPCDRCRRRFPLIASLVLRHPYRRTDDAGQTLRLHRRNDEWHTEVIDGIPDQQPTFAAAPGRRGKSGVCLFCQHVHTLDTVKAKGFAGQYSDALLAVADGGDTPRKTWRVPRADEIAATESPDKIAFEPFGDLPAVPDEPIPAGNNHTIRASAYGYRTYGELMNPRQTIQYVATVRSIREIYAELVEAGASADYAAALTGYAVANMQRRLRRSTRGAKLLCHGNANGTGQNRVQADHIFADESKVSFQFDYVETGPSAGPATWSSVAEPGLNALRKVLQENRGGRPARFRQASAVALPYRDNTVLAVVTDPPYYNMIDYLDASDLFHVWMQRALFDIMPDLFATPGLQDKSDEIIVKNGNAPGEHRIEPRYEEMLGKAFKEARRVLRTDGHLVVVFGHSDPDAWRRLLAALRDAGFVITSSWPSRTETSNTGVASIKVTVTIGCRVAPPDRPASTAAEVDREILAEIKERVREWDNDGLALPDQLMAAYGPAMEVYGRYSQVLRPDGTTPELEHYLTLARAAVRAATTVRLDEIPLDTFDPATRFAVFWLRLFGRTDVPKGEARFAAQVDGLDIDDLRGPLLTESRAGFRLRTDSADAISAASSTFEVARTLAAAWDSGGTDAAAAVLTQAGRGPADRHLWAVVRDIAAQLPPSDAVATSLAAVIRNASTIGSLAGRQTATRARQLTLDDD